MADSRSLSVVGAALAAAAGAAIALAAGLALAVHHPVAPGWALGLFLAWSALAAWRRGLWLFALPAALPILNFAPWTGWLIFDEFDLLVLGGLAAGFARLAIDCDVTACRRSLWMVLALMLGALGLFGFLRGVHDAGGWAFDWFHGYAEPLNSWRVFKGWLYPLLLLPMLHREVQRSKADTVVRLSRGMLVGVGVTAVAILWERTAYPGLWNFSAPYRTTALFWEMHVGGAALDVYLVLAAPFIAWSLRSARSWAEWTVAAVVALLAAYAALTTFSRGVYLGTAAALTLLGWWLWARPRSRTPVRAASARNVAAMLLALALLAETVAVLAGGSFMLARFSAGDRDFGDRLAHWQRGLRLLDDPADWLWGKGLGRLPSHYAGSALNGEFSGAVSLAHDASGKRTLRLFGPATSRRLGGLYGISQRVPLDGRGPYSVRLRVQADKPVTLELTVCEMHLLYARRCQGSLLRLREPSTSWQDIALGLPGPEVSRGDWWAPRMGVFELSVVDPGRSATLGRVALKRADGVDALVNDDFAAGLAGWFPIAHDYFLPWHIDNLWLELLIERGIMGLSAFVLLVVCAFRRLACAEPEELPFAAFLAASLCGALIVGSLSSVMDTPRIALLLMLLGFLALQLTEPSVSHDHDRMRPTRL